MSSSSCPISVSPTTAATAPFVRRRSLPAVTLPRGREDRRVSALASVLVHLLIVMLLVTPFAVHHAIVEREQGAGGPGPAGGGGGGHAGTGGAPVSERLQFMQVAPQPAPEATPIVQTPPPPVPPPEPLKVEPKPTPPVEPKIAMVAPAIAPQVATTPGVGGGTGHDGTNGSGPGSGGGVGTGVGTGRGSGMGPGTGGGNQENYPPSLQEMAIPPMPVPDKVRGAHVVAEFDVDSTGRVLGYDFSRTKDNDYNKRLDEIFRRYRFKAGSTPDGRPLRMKAQVVMDLP